MQVISGKYRGKKLQALVGSNTRPTTQRVKEDIFNILNNYFLYEGKISLDLFGGSGALSLEGLSRGIKLAYVNDHHKLAIKVIEQNFNNVDSSTYHIYNWDYFQLLKYLTVQNITVDLIYLDPPFAQLQYYYDFFNYLQTNKLLNDYGIVITESEKPLELEKISELVLLKHKAYKTKHLYLFRREDKE
ncbi:N6-adenine-specific methylase [Spiroplasma clarkii]|uniref:N6-adenine-specific methylase n=1 Tax=Spiroplasma clarkii TaxID=2139 RepID=A0A1Y0L0I0_9MOLU|nr:16S rRNA (guanine(966)-N(2))-methyltransferase RsmD [Spiroplasma clarkii]ARU91209.1 N6-adenine-specific methylase [Spiroplasma clarkii]ATX70647.1 N6-adenine-specific methylase [Spiroplasma clarkii]